MNPYDHLTRRETLVCIIFGLALFIGGAASATKMFMLGP